MSYRLPPLNGLRAFEAAARHLSFKRAGDELCVTPGAVSQQVKALEADLGIRLFRRMPRGLILTSQGEAYLPAISAAFRAISAATDSTAPALRGRKLRLGIAPQILASGWPAVRDLRKRQSANAIVEVRETDDIAELLAGRLDALLRSADSPHPGLHADRLVVPDGNGGSLSSTLLTLPGLAGCREHRSLVDLLRG